MLSALGCGEDASRTQFVLTHLAGQALPSVLDVIRTTNGDTVVYQMESGYIVLLDNKRFEISSTLHELRNGELFQVTSAANRGFFEATPTGIAIRFTDNQGIDRRFEYAYSADRKTLRGVQWELDAEYSIEVPEP